ncbi:MAG: hypothetical protein AYP45_05655 [Candidatus Brocadia carolinensis]|uniref:Uncharacterized protein n=1 Tax=Candidatus Brocadia carolinensis TaxID=1004156 RepID=A0A1V4AVE7_9BACT|nr:MAG: hypothetical protein AYP45_05655 [Candidatus Brocadia caroliniensis]
MSEIKMLYPVFKGLFKDVKAKDKNKICVQGKISFLVCRNGVYAFSVNVFRMTLLRGNGIG